MAWRIRAKVYESCSCKMVCRCTLGPAQPDQEWCSGVMCVQVLEGHSEGVDLAGTRVALHFELPHDFLSGVDKAKLYLDTSLSDEQRGELEAVLHGERGGLFAGMREMIAEWLPSTVTDIDISDGEAPKVLVGGAGELILQALTTEDGRRATLTNAPVAAAFGENVIELAMANGSHFSDPDLRRWESLGYGAVSEVEWSS